MSSMKGGTNEIMPGICMTAYVPFESKELVLTSF